MWLCLCTTLLLRSCLKSTWLALVWSTSDAFNCSQLSLLPLTQFFCSPWWYSKYRHTAICFFFASDSSILRSDFVWGFSLHEVPPELYQVFEHILRDTEWAIRLVIKWTAERLDLSIRKEKTYPNKKFFNVIHNRGVTLLSPSHAAARRNNILQTYPFTHKG